VPLSGTVTSVDTEYVSAVLAAAADATDTTITLDSVAALAPTGTLRLQGIDFATGDDVSEDIDYTAVDTETLVVTLDGALVNAYDADTDVLVLPLQPVTWATVDYDTDDDPTQAFVPEYFCTTLYPAFEDGPYEPGAGAEVVIDDVAGVMTVIKVIRVPSAINGAAIDPATTIPPGALTDGIAPADAPADVITIGGLGLIFVKWSPITNPDPVTYEVHVSDTAAFTPSPTTLLTTTPGSMIAAKTLADDTPFVYGDTYYFQVIATDADGAGPASAEVDDQMNQTGTPDIVVGSITAALLETILVISNTFATADPGLGTQRIEWDTDGIRSYDPSGNLLIEWDSATGVMTWKSGASGSRVELDEGGMSTFTNDPIAVRTLPGTTLFNVATDGTYIYAYHFGVGIRKFDAATGVENLSGFPIATVGVQGVAVLSGYVYAIDGSSDIRKYDSTTGTQNLSGFPISGSYAYLAADSGFLYAKDTSSSDIRKFDATTGVENTSGFPIAGTFNAVAVGGGYIYTDSNATELRKYDATSGVQDTADDFPISGNFLAIAVNDGDLFATDFASDEVRKFDAATGVENTSGFPIAGLALTSFSFNGIAADDSQIYAATTRGLRVYNNAEGYQSVRVDSSDGTLDLRAIAVSDLTAAGAVDLTGTAFLGGISLAGDDFTNVTYNGSWADFGSPYEEVSYRLLADGTVQLRGLAKHATTSTTGIVFTLPVGYRPAKTRHYKIDAGPGWAIITIASGGVVAIASYVSSGSAANVSFDGVSFDTAA